MKAIGQRILLFLCLVAPGAAHLWAAASAVLVPEAQVWKYDQSGLDLGSDWRLPSYDDSAWPSGPGIFAFPTNENTLGGTIRTALNLFGSGSSTGRIVTYYFRTTFLFTNESGMAALVFSNRIDDGVVFYLNGQEIQRLGMSSNAVTAASLATRSDDISTHGVEVFAIPSDHVLAGTNLLAAELHQPNMTSGDVVFGTVLVAQELPPTALSISNNPVDVVVEESKTAVFSASVTGSGARFQWFKDGVAIPGATKATLILSNVSTADAGWYALRASNAVSDVFSLAACLEVVLDSKPPRLIAGDIVSNSAVLLSFSEAIAFAGATNVQNYFITNTGGGTMPIVSATPTNATNVLLLIGSALVPDRNYVARVNRITDSSPLAHLIATNSMVPLARTVTLTPFDASWDFYEPLELAGDNPDPGPNWRDDDFGLSPLWGTGNGAFFWTFDDSEPPVPVNTILFQTDTVTSYFRNRFASQASRGGLRLSLRHATDDGVVFYLNGAEIARFNMPAGAVTHTTAASVPVNLFTVREVTDLPVSSFRAGSNLFAAELHQAIRIDQDWLFAVELVARMESLLAGPLLVTGGPDDSTVSEGGSVEFSVASVAAETFQWQQNSNAIAGATNPIYRIDAVPLSLDGAKLRLRLANSNSFIFTTNATLRVLADTNPPTLVSAVLSNNNVIVVTFSEFLSAASAANKLNYSVTNSTGPVPTLNSATLVNGTNVVLTFANLLAGRYTVTVSNVTDASLAHNVIAPGSAVIVGADYFIPIDSAWKYLLINTNATVQAAFAGVSYDDSSWSGPSNALFYVESAVLPGPKNTALSLFADQAQTQRINTYYFRQRLFAPVAGGPVILRLRHIIDDGLVLHLNGVEIYRFNMPTNIIVSAGSQAPMNVGDAVLLGPFDVLVTNLLAGTNVFAAEVHQNGTTSADVVFGVEISTAIPGGVLPFAQPAPRLTLRRSVQQHVIEWPGRGTLDCAPAVTGPWVPLTGGSPYLVSPTNARSFYRVRR